MNLVTWLTEPGDTDVVTEPSSLTLRLTRRSTRKLAVFESTGVWATPPTEKLTVAVFWTLVPAMVPAAFAAVACTMPTAVVSTSAW